MSDILQNHHVADTPTEGFSTFRRSYRVFHHHKNKGRTILEWEPRDPAVVLTPEHALPYDGLLRSEFAAAQRTGADRKIINRVKQAFGVHSIDAIRETRRTVGAGTMVYLSLRDGIFQPMVERTAPSQTPDGVPNPGVYSRAAGGVTFDIRETAFSELTEELNIAAAFGSGHMYLASLDLVPENPDVSDKVLYAAIGQKQDRVESIFGNETDYTGIIMQPIRTTEFTVDGLSEEVHQVLDGDLSVLNKVVHFDHTNNGDVDTLIFADMRQYASKDLIIADGETDLCGEPLNRTWVLERPESWFKALNEGEKKFSPMPRKIIAKTPEILAAIAKLSL